MKNKQIKTLVCVLLATHGIAGLATDAPTMSTNKVSATVKLKTFKPTSNSINQPHMDNLQELSPDTIQTIQFIGRSVLAAKHNEVADPNAAQVKARLQSLRLILDDMIKADATPVSSALVLISSGETHKTDSVSTKQISQTGKTDSDAERRKHKQGIDEKISSLKQHLSEIKSDNKQRKQGFTGNPENEHQLHMRHLVDKSQTISDEIDLALADKGPERMDKLTKLRNRLTAKTLIEMQHETQSTKTVIEEAPTISTITRHRE